MSEHNYGHGFYKLFSWLGGFLSPFVLLLFRLVFGWLFFRAGLAKFSDIGGTIEAFEGMGVAAPFFNAWLVAFVETLCGIALFLGFASRIAAFPLVITMIVALYIADFEVVANFFNDPKAAVVGPAPVPFLMASLAVLCFGPGCFSVDYLVEKFWCKNHCDV